MLRVEEGRFEPGYVELTEGALQQLDDATTHLDFGHGRLSHFSASVLEVGRTCGRVVLPNTNPENARGILRQLTANMREEVAQGFVMGYAAGMEQEVKFSSRELPSTVPRNV